ncbi:B12-binding domain-containing radical SAM protein [Parasporobacterium paucivorans]|uniref:Anaerobic magnesium-protoporphyrin IX monomethyl ester cyclase n=1 Tax=Parasporobacterium paucivorans DSM 15970 TaxID=1122934 RepID=A0A1M6HBW6_9FIRM|nr:radical SAM protein [Parasporobacterium paucivorans]SHJ19681.1 anaerobic magnesium-protoporphyrin IX monomethyl ester cyclase [Parasporobacterium paucivorans DSM 15970]
MKKVLLVYPYFYTGAVKDQLFAPIGIGILSAVLKQKGLEVMKLDCTFLTMEEAIKKSREYAPDITGIYIMTTLVKNALELVEKLREVNPSSVYTTGGPLPTLYPVKFAEKFDYVFRGEAANSFPDFCQDYLNASDRIEFVDNMDPSKYPGIFSTKTRPIDSPATHLTKVEIDECPPPDREGFNHEKYQGLCFECSGRKKASIMMTYGCPFSCDFCSKPIFGSEVRFRSLDKIFEEIGDIVSHGYDSLWIADDLFTYDAHFLKNFCTRLIEEDLQLSWSCLSRVDSVTHEMVMMMKKAGCTKVYFGIESGNDYVLKLMNKKIDRTKVREGVEVFRRNGIECAGFFIVGYPGETIDTIEETFEFALSLGLDEISFNVPYPLPGSKLFERVSGICDDDWTFENETRFLYKSEFDETWLKKRILETQETFEGLRLSVIRGMP